MSETEDYSRAGTLGAHKTTHQDGGADEISVLALSGLLADDQHVLDAEVKLIKLDDFAAPDDNTDLNASISKHGLLKKLNNVATQYLNGQGGWSTPPDTTVPYAHKTTHQNGGADEISVTGLSGLLADDQHVLDAEVKLIKLDDFAAPDDNTDLDASTTKHGLLRKLDNVVTNFLNGEGGWSVPPGSGAGFPATTNMLFGQSLAPTGWTKKTDWTNNSMIVYTTGNIAQGGSVDAKAPHQHGAFTLAINEMPPHSHQYDITSDVNTPFTDARGGKSFSASIPTDSTGGGNSHQHPENTAPLYLSVIAAVKD